MDVGVNRDADWRRSWALKLTKLACDYGTAFNTAQGWAGSSA
jgi:hypothetical protein